jgi:hypothetical protein
MFGNRAVREAPPGPIGMLKVAAGKFSSFAKSLITDLEVVPNFGVDPVTIVELPEKP